jgi:DNA-binding transcriptional regulator GbsR (MarR family)
MTKESSQIFDELIFQAGQIATKLRLNKSMGQLYAALYFSDDPVSLDDLAKKCRMSKGNASINIRHLERWNAVSKTYSNGNRKDYYLANKDVIGFTVGRGMALFSDVLNKGESVLKGAAEKVNSIDVSNSGEEDMQTIEKYKENLEDLSSKFNKLKKLSENLGVIETMLKGALK